MLDSISQARTPDSDNSPHIAPLYISSGLRRMRIHNNYLVACLSKSDRLYRACFCDNKLKEKATNLMFWMLLISDSYDLIGFIFSKSHSCKICSPISNLPHLGQHFP